MNSMTWECGATGCRATGSDTASQAAHLRATHPRPRAIVGELSIVTADGTELRARTDVELARLWAAHENGGAWEAMRWQDQNADVADALSALRRANEASL